jgi:hypothetical protein
VDARHKAGHDSFANSEGLCKVRNY